MAKRRDMRRQTAAVLALVFLLSALLTAVLALVQGDPWRVAVLPMAVAICVVGLWFALSRKGLARLIGAMVSVAAFGGILAIALTTQYRGAVLVLALLLIACSALTARYALGRDPRTLRSMPLAGRPAPRPARPVLLMNQWSGGGKVARFGLVDECRRRGIEPVVLQTGDDLLQLAEDAVARGADVIGMAGGDGSQALVAGVAMEHDLAHICIPAGTRNHFALDLGLDRDDVVGALDAFVDGVEQRVDLARVNGRIFVNNASMGLYAKIVQAEAYRNAKLKTAADMLPDMIGPGAEPFDLRFQGPDGTTYPTAHLILVSNDPYQLDHLGGRGTRERMDLGNLGIVAARITDAKEVVAFVAAEAAGRIRSFRGWLEWNAPRFVIDSGGPIEIGIDGEALRMDPPLAFESLPGALRVRLPTHAPGFAPAVAAVPLTPSTIGDLLRAAVGRS
ncbi:MAG: diacylglycerol kinase [Candidatus Dormibacteraeota bacterium]|nr:diacylglycerol kinase [Candidatus Dormibacteraeota bacterium]